MTLLTGFFVWSVSFVVPLLHDFRRTRCRKLVIVLDWTDHVSGSLRRMKATGATERKSEIDSTTRMSIGQDCTLRQKPPFFSW